MTIQGKLHPSMQVQTDVIESLCYGAQILSYFLNPCSHCLDRDPEHPFLDPEHPIQDGG